MLASKNELLEKERINNSNNVYLSDQLVDVLSNIDDDFDFDQSLNKFNFAYLHYNDVFYKTELIELDKDQKKVAIILKCGSDVIKSLCEDKLDKITIEFSEDYIFEMSTSNLLFSYNIKVLGDVNSYIVTITLSEV